MELNYSDRGIARWLLIGVAMIVVQTLLGGITRLTGSGLSITEWNLATLQAAHPDILSFMKLCNLLVIQSSVEKSNKF